MFWLFLGAYFALKIWYTFHKAKVAKLEKSQWEAGYRRAQAEAAQKAQAFAAWEAEQRAAWRAKVAARQKQKTEEAKMDPNLWLLGLSSYPDSLDELKQARRKAMLRVHPDLGGAATDAVAVNSAYSELARRYAA